MLEAFLSMDPAMTFLLQWVLPTVAFGVILRALYSLQRPHK